MNLMMASMIFAIAMTLLNVEMAVVKRFLSVDFVPPPVEENGKKMTEITKMTRPNIDEMKTLADNQLLKLAREKTAAYVDMGHFRKPEEATPYLVDGFQRGYREARKDIPALIGYVESLEKANKLLINIINSSPCDFDITVEQDIAWEEYRKFMELK